MPICCTRPDLSARPTLAARPSFLAVPLLLLVLSCLTLPSVLRAQAVAVTATVNSTSGGEPYALGSYTVSLVDASGNPLSVPGYQNQFSGSLSSAGTLALSLFPNSQVATGSQWKFLVCSGRPVALALPGPTPSPSCLALPVTITGAGDISSTLSSAAPAFYPCTQWSGSAWVACGGPGSFTALTGDATSTSTGGATTVVGLKGNLLPSLSTGYLNWTGTAWALSSTTGVVSSVFGRTGAVVAAANDYSFSQLSGSATNSQLATQTANTVLGALTATTPSGLALPSCSGATSALTWTSGTGFGCNIIAGSGTTTNAITGNNSGTGAASGSTFNGSAAVTWSYNTFGASPLAGSTSLTTLGTIATGTWQGTTIGTQYGGNGQNWSSSSGLEQILSGTSSLYNTNCNTAGSSALTWTVGTGVGCNTITAGGGTTTNPVTFNNSGSGASSGTTFNGSSAVTVSYNTVGAAQANPNQTPETASFTAACGSSYRITSGTVTVTLPSACTTGGVIFIQNVSATAATLTAGSITYNGPSTLTQYQSVSLQYDGTNLNASYPPASSVLNTSATFTQTIGSGTAAMGTSAITSGTCATAVTVAASGVATTDTITYTPNANPTGTTGYAPSASGSLYIWAYPTAGNVNFAVCNPSSGSITPGALTLNWRVVR
jgi:hypothetical protein